MSSNEFLSNVGGLKIEDINELRKNIIQNSTKLTELKHQIKSSDYTQLMNYHYYILNTLNNMVNTRTVELNQSYGKLKQASMYPGSYEPNNMHLVTRCDGRTSVMNTKNADAITQEWATPFSNELNIHAPRAEYNNFPRASNSWLIQSRR